MKRNFAKALKILGYIFVGIGILSATFVISQSNKNDSLNNLYFIGTVSSVIIGLILVGIAEIIITLQIGFYEITKSQNETKNILFMIYKELKSKSNYKKD